MDDNAELGISQAQLGQRGALGKRHERGVKNLDDKTGIFLFALGVLALMVVWATATSDLVIYGSFGAVIILAVLWGLWRIRQIRGLRKYREKQVAEIRAQSEK